MLHKRRKVVKLSESERISQQFAKKLSNIAYWTRMWYFTELNFYLWNCVNKTVTKLFSSMNWINFYDRKRDDMKNWLIVINFWK